MKRSRWLSRTLVLGLTLLLGWLIAGSCEASKLEYPRPCNPCMPNVAHWGHFRTVWRQWPGEETPERTNPQAIGREVLPTPPGQEIVPPPKAAPSELPLPEPKEPEEEWPTIPEGTIQPPEGLLLPEHRPGALPRVPEREQPLPEGGLPGLTPPEPLPGLPPESESPQKTPANNQSSQSSGAKETNSSETPTLPPRSTSQMGRQAAVESSATVGTQGAVKLPDTIKQPDTVKLPGRPAFQPVPPQKPKVETKQPAPPSSSSSRSPTGDSVRLQTPAESLPFHPPAPAVASVNAGRQREMVLPAGGIAPERNEVLPAGYRFTPVNGAGDEASRPVHLQSYPLDNLPAREELAARTAIPPVALKGYCPVELVRNGRWVQGDVQWTVVYKGWIYRFSGAQQRRDFLAEPERYVPVNAGNDVVLALDTGRDVPGLTAYCAIYNGRLYMFSSAATQAQFNREPQRYAVEQPSTSDAR